MKLAVYEELCDLNRGFDQVRRALLAMQTHRLFDASELRRCRDLAAESQAVISRYLAHVIETAESDHAGRLFRRRIARERQEDSGRQ